MLSRRELIAAGVTGGLTTTADAGPAIPETQPSDREGLRDVQRAIEKVDTTLRSSLQSNSTAYGLAGKVRGAMEQFFRTNAKFPDFIDIGLAIFMEVYDWHVKNRQQLMVTRGADGRYWMQFMFTTLILRAEVDPAYMGVPYDKA
jgi:hypothetical protein